MRKEKKNLFSILNCVFPLKNQFLSSVIVLCISVHNLLSGDTLLTAAATILWVV